MAIKIIFNAKGGDIRLLPYWQAVKQFRQGKHDGLSPQYYWLYIESNPHTVCGHIASDIMAALPYHLLYKMQRNFGL